MLNSLLLALAVFAQAQPQPVPVAAYRDFSGGYVDNVDPVQLKPNESPKLLNVQVDNPVGSLKPRKGYTRCGNVPSGNVPTNLYEYTRSDGTRRLIVTDNATVYSTPDCQTWTTVTNSGLVSSAQVHFATVRDKLWIVNGSTWPQTWDGTTAVMLDGKPDTPRPPPGRCAFIEFWKERVWCGAPQGDPSGVAFSALTGVDGNDLDPSTGTLSWPAINVFEIDQNAGSRLYGLKAYRNRLYAFKDNGVWEIGFDNEFSNFVRKTFASVGSRYQTSIAEVDGILYFTGRDGIYAFDGDNAVRVSRKIENKFRTLNQPLVSQNYKLWTTQTDFEAGTLSSATAGDISGAVTVSSEPALVQNGDFETGSISPKWSCGTSLLSGSAAGGGPSCGIDNTAPIQGVYSASMTIAATCTTNQSACSYALFDVSGSTKASGRLDSSSLLTATTITVNTAGFNGTDVRVHIYYGCNTSQADLYSSTFTANTQLTFQVKGNAATCTDILGGSGYTLFLDNFQSFRYKSQGTWTSPIYNTVAVSTWSSFQASQDENGGSVSYAVKVGSNTGAIAARPWVPIVSGAIINGTTDQIYAQVKATLTPKADLQATPEVQDVQIAWNSGSNNTQKIYAAGWQNALWVAASSGTGTSNNIVLNHSRPPLDAWTLHDQRIGPMATYNDAFYAGASTHSAIYRMDYGTNDDGAAIEWSWESKDENFGLPNNAKYLTEIDADYRNDASCNVRMGYLVDQSTVSCVGNFPSQSPLPGGVGSRRLNVSGGPAYTYRLKVCDDQKDQAPTIIGLQGIGRAINRRGD